MNGREYFHESVVKDIIDIITDLKDFDEVQFINNVNNKRSFKSITSATKDLILTFPVMVSTDIEPDNAIMIAKAQEKKMASLLHILFTAISVDCNEDVYDYVRKFHANVGSMGGTLDSYSDAFDKLATTFGESYDATLKIDHAVLETVLEELKESNYTLPDNVNESSLESYKIVPGYRTGYDDMIIQEVTYNPNSKYNKNGNKHFLDFDGGDLSDPDIYDKLGDFADSFGAGSQDNIDKYFDRFSNAFDNFRDYWDDVASKMGYSDGASAYKGWENGEFKIRGMQGNGSVNSQSSKSSPLGNMRATIEKTYKREDDFETGLRRRIDELETKAAQGNLTPDEKAELETKRKSLQNLTDNKDKMAYQKSMLPRDNRPRNIQDLDMAKYMESMTKAHNAVVLNNEYKKANELQPTMMVINFMKKDKNDEGYINTAVIGIKCKIYPITSADIVNRISGKLKDKNFLTNFVRATTNEIAFFRDFLFAVDQAKFDAKSYGKNASSNKLWKVLERRSVKSRFRRSLKMYNDATAISTLVMSENDAEYLKKVDNVDILEVAKARKIMDEYNFMCLVVANQSTEVASFLYDTGDDTFEMIPFSGLEREASDNSYKKMVNLLSKVSR